MKKVNSRKVIKCFFIECKNSTFEELKKKMKLAIVGATGMVGREMLEVLFERAFPFSDLITVASVDSFGDNISYKGKEFKIISLKELLEIKIDLAFFSAGGEVSRIWAPKLVAKGVKVIDNSSYWRMSEKHKLIVPEINGSEINRDDMLIANPNCSTIQLVMALAPLHQKYCVERVVVSTYQSVSGTGKGAIQQLEREEKKLKTEMVYPHQIYRNALPHCDDFIENGYTKEEVKLTNETKKILDEKIEVTATAVRVPVFSGHSESVNITFKKEFKLEDIPFVLSKMNGIHVLDNPKNNEYPMPINVRKKDGVFIGRIRRDFSQKKSLNMWIVADNLRKGAATNTVQIAEYLINNKLL